MEFKIEQKITDASPGDVLVLSCGDSLSHYMLAENIKEGEYFLINLETGKNSFASASISTIISCVNDGIPYTLVRVIPNSQLVLSVKK